VHRFYLKVVRYGKLSGFANGQYAVALDHTRARPGGVPHFCTRVLFWL